MIIKNKIRQTKNDMNVKRKPSWETSEGGV
jgi:hypothetical protein